jgi:3-deoxy-7-phosphoheptulonate synthase
VEDEASFLRTALDLKAAGAQVLRGGAFKPRTSPYSFQGLGQEGLRILAQAKKATGLPVITEVMDTRTVDEIAAIADILQVGARNMQNFALLKELGRIRRPVLLKRGLSATLEEWLLAAEYILSSGNPHVILCERGQRLLGESGRCGLDLCVIPVLRELSRLPLIVDPSHAAAARGHVAALSRGAVAAGAHGLMIEVHEQPEKSRSDADRSLSIDGFQAFMAELPELLCALDRRLQSQPAG